MKILQELPLVARARQLRHTFVQGLDEKHIHRAFVRGNVDEAARAYQLREVQVRVEPDVEWADVVRTVDGARTCCGSKRLAVAIDRGEPAPPQ